MSVILFFVCVCVWMAAFFFLDCCADDLKLKDTIIVV